MLASTEGSATVLPVPRLLRQVRPAPPPWGPPPRPLPLGSWSGGALAPGPGPVNPLAAPWFRGMLCVEATGHPPFSPFTARRTCTRVGAVGWVGQPVGGGGASGGLCQPPEAVHRPHPVPRPHGPREFQSDGRPAESWRNPVTAPLVVAGLLLALCAFFSTSATVLFALGEPRVRTLLEEGFRGARALAEVRQQGRVAEVWLWLLSYLAGLAAVGVATGWSAHRGGVVGLWTAFPLSLLAVLVGGILLPRLVAARRPVRVALALAPSVHLLLRWLGPALRPLQNLEDLVGGGEEEGRDRSEVREVREIAALGRREGVVEKEEHELVERAFRLDELTAWDVMTPRVEIFAWKDSLTLEEVVKELEQVPYSRVPVYGQSVDDITGILHIRDIYQGYIAGRGHLSLKAIAREPFFVPGSLPLTRLLRDFQTRRIHMGIVADEFGGTDGLVTLEDILEELVGEIADETDLPEEPIVRVSKTEAIVDGGIDLRELNYAFNVSLPSLEHRSLNGFILEELGYVPSKGETLERHGVRIDVLDASDTQVLRVRIRKLAPSAPQEES